MSIHNKQCHNVIDTSYQQIRLNDKLLVAIDVEAAKDFPNEEKTYFDSLSHHMLIVYI